MGADAGLVYKMAKTQAGDTMDAHQTVQLAKREALQMQTVERIYKAHFADEENIFDKDALVRLATDVGLDRNAVTSILAGDEFKDEVEADERAVKQMGNRGVPFFVVNDQIGVRGIQPPEHFLSILNQAWQAQNPQSHSHLQTA
jgi:predicted DsbA family dithiol-disulfide isomerase